MKVINLHQEERELIELAVENNRHAQHKIYSKFSPKMLSVCRQYIKDLHEAEDIMITAFMKVFTNLKNFKTRRKFRRLDKTNNDKRMHFLYQSSKESKVH